MLYLFLEIWKFPNIAMAWGEEWGMKAITLQRHQTSNAIFTLLLLLSIIQILFASFSPHIGNLKYFQIFMSILKKCVCLFPVKLTIWEIWSCPYVLEQMLEGKFKKYWSMSYNVSANHLNLVGLGYSKYIGVFMLLFWGTLNLDLLEFATKES